MLPSPSWFAALVGFFLLGACQATTDPCVVRAERAEATVRALRHNIRSLVRDSVFREQLLDTRTHLAPHASHAPNPIPSRLARNASASGDTGADVHASTGENPVAACANSTELSNSGVCTICGGNFGSCSPDSLCYANINATCAALLESFQPIGFSYSWGPNISDCIPEVVCVDCSRAQGAGLDRVPCPPDGYTGDNTSKVLLILDNARSVDFSGAFGRLDTGNASPYPRYLAGLSLVNSTINGSQLRLTDMWVGPVNMSWSTVRGGFHSSFAFRAVFYGAFDLSHANVGAGIANSSFTNAIFRQNFLLRGANVTAGIFAFAFAKTNLRNFDLSNAIVSGGIFTFAFAAANFGWFNMDGANISAGIQQFSFENIVAYEGVSAVGADISGGIHEGAFMKATIENILNMSGANLSGGITTNSFERSYVEGIIDLSSTDISAGLSTSCFRDLSVNSMSLQGARISTGISNTAFSGASFQTDFDLSGADVSGGIARNTFIGALFIGSFRMVGTNFAAGGLQPGAFLGMTVVGTLNASGARFPNNSLATQTFYGFNAQGIVDLSRCQISTLETRPCPVDTGCIGVLSSGTFMANLSRLGGGPFTGMSMPVGIKAITVDLSHNDLTVISESSLLGITATTIDLSHNPHLAVFQPQWSLGVPNVRVIATTGNPSVCTWVSGSDSATGNYTYAETASVVCTCASGTSGTGSFCAREPCNASLAALNVYAAHTLGGTFSPGTESVPSGGHATFQCPSGKVPNSQAVEAQCLGGAFSLQTNQCIEKKLSPGEIAAIVLGCLVVAAIAGYFLLLSPERRKRRDLSYTLIDTKKQTELNERLLEETKGDLEEATALNSRMRGAWKIEEADVTVGNVLASGGFGVVHSGTFGGLPVAVKILKRPLDEELYPDVGREFARECETLMAARHASLLIFYGAGLTTENRPFMVTEFMPRGSLRAVLLNPAMEMDWGTRTKVALQIARAMEYLHEIGIVHRDLKSDNVLLGDQLDAKVCDFGTSRFLTSSRRQFQETSFSDGDVDALPSEALTATMTKGVGTILWMAPELFLGGSKYGPEVDVYSYGIILWELATRSRPWSHIEEAQYIQFFAALSKAFEAGERPPISTNIVQTQPRMVQLIEKCWVTDPIARPPFSSIVIWLTAK